MREDTSHVVHCIAIKPVGGIAIASSRLRAYLVVKELTKKSINIEIFDHKHINNYDLVIFQKAYTDADIKLAKQLKSRSCKIALDQCDNHFIYDIDDADQCKRAKNLRAMVDEVDVVIASTDKISELFPDKVTFVVNDFIEIYESTWFDRFKARRQARNIFKGDALKLVWFGSVGSDSPRFGMCDIAQKIGLLNELSSQYNIQLTVISNSVSTFEKYFSGQHQFTVYYLEWQRETYEYLVGMHDICLIPIDINPFTICKSNNRLVLSLFLGLPVVADEIPSYSEFSNFVKLGSWDENLRYVVRNLSSERQLASHGQKYVLENYSNDFIANIWLLVIRNILKI